MKNKTPIVITSINKPTKAILKFSKLKDFVLFVAGDNKTPKNWHLNGAKFISIKEQHKKYPKLSKAITENHYARKNLAYLAAIKRKTEFIFETDDDNFPNECFPNFYKKSVGIEEVTAPLAFNIYSLFTKERIWPRGLPLNYTDKKNTICLKKKKIFPLIQQSLADLDPDVDAIYRLTIGKKIKFKKGKKFALAKNTFCPFNSQNTYWHKKVFVLLYLPSTVTSRITDIWRSYVAQRILWELGSQLIFLSPSLYQKRNQHNLIQNLRNELDLYLRSEELISNLSEMKLKGSIEKMLICVYKNLAANGFVKKKELNILSLWLKELKNYQS